MFLRRLSFALALAVTALGSPLDDAVALYNSKKYPEARELLEKILAADPKNAAAAYKLGMTLRNRGDSNALADAIVWLAKAVDLEPNNAIYLGDFGGTSMELAGKTRSYSAAIRGRDAMIRAIELDPNYLEAREGLMQFYAQAPWPVGSKTKAEIQAQEIRKRDPHRGLSALVGLRLGEKDFAGAHALCEEALRAEPENYLILFQIGRIASLSGEDVDRGLVTLRRCLELTPPPGAPTHSHAQFRIGTLLEKKNDPAGARAAYEAALKLDPNNRAATDALTKLP